MLDRMVVLLADHGANDPALRSKSEKWGQAHRANRSSSTEKRRRFNGPELRPSGRRASTLVESTATRLNQHSPADGSTRAAHTRGSLPPRTSTNCTGASSSDDCSAMAKKKCARGRSARLEVVHCGRVSVDLQDARDQAIAKAEAVRGNVAWLVRTPHTVPMQTPGQEGPGRAPARRAIAGARRIDRPPPGVVQDE